MRSGMVARDRAHFADEIRKYFILINDQCASYEEWWRVGDLVREADIFQLFLSFVSLVMFIPFSNPIQPTLAKPLFSFSVQTKKEPTEIQVIYMHRCANITYLTANGIRIRNMDRESNRYNRIVHIESL